LVGTRTMLGWLLTVFWASICPRDDAVGHSDTMPTVEQSRSPIRLGRAHGAPKVSRDAPARPQSRVHRDGPVAWQASASVKRRVTRHRRAGLRRNRQFEDELDGRSRPLSPGQRTLATDGPMSGLGQKLSLRAFGKVASPARP
jgi:hypothetical protein